MNINNRFRPSRRRFLVAASMLSISCAARQQAPPPSKPQVTDATSLAFPSRSPEIEAADAAARGDWRYLGVVRFSLEVPGVEDEIDRIVDVQEPVPPHVRIICNIGDANVSRMMAEIGAEAAAYAEVYNRSIQSLRDSAIQPTRETAPPSEISH